MVIIQVSYGLSGSFGVGINVCAASVGYPPEWRLITTASYICEDFCKVNIYEQTSSLREAGRHVSAASSFLRLPLEVMVLFVLVLGSGTPDIAWLGD
jgi:hypothetical protein